MAVRVVLARVTVACFAAALVVGGLWAAVAPTRRGLCGPDGRCVEARPDEIFGGVGIFALISGIAGIALALGMWRLVRAARGPVMVLLLPLCALPAAYTAAVLGEAVAGLFRGAREMDGEVVVLTVPPVIGTVWVVLVMPFAAAFTYWARAALAADPDLGVGEAAELRTVVADDSASGPIPDPGAAALEAPLGPGLSGGGVGSETGGR